jgi:hypothetical protein
LNAEAWASWIAPGVVVALIFLLAYLAHRNTPEPCCQDEARDGAWAPKCREDCAIRKAMTSAPTLRARASEVETLARELLAKEYRFKFGAERADRMMSGPWDQTEDAALRAIAEALIRSSAPALPKNEDRAAPIYFQIWEETGGGTFFFKGYVTERAVRKLRSGDVSRHVLGSPKVGAEDHLVSLARIFRNYREQNT